MEELKEKQINNTQYKELASDIGIFMIGTVVAKAVQFFLMPLYTTYMTTGAYGAAELTNNLSELLFPIATLCIHEAAFRFAVDTEFSNGKLIAAVVNVMVRSCIVGALAAVVAKLVFGYERAFFLYFILYSYSIKTCAAYYTRGEGQSKTFVISGIINAVFLSLFNILFLVIWNFGESGYLISIGMSYTVSAVYLILKSKANKNIEKKVKKKDYRTLFTYCMPLIPYNILYGVTTISGRYILLYFSDTSTAGRYVATIKIAAVINMIQQAVYAALQLNASRKYDEKDKEQYYSDTINMFIGLYCIFGSSVICATPILAKLTLKNDFYSARVFLPAIMLSAIFNCISSVLGTMYSAYKQTKHQIGVSVVGAFVNVLFGILLVKRIGIWGICIASILCYLSQVIYKFVDVKKISNIAYRWKFIIANMSLISLQAILLSLDENNILLCILITIILLAINGKVLLFCFQTLISLIPRKKDASMK